MPLEISSPSNAQPIPRKKTTTTLSKAIYKSLAQYLYTSPPPSPLPTPKNPIIIICISDTHTSHPPLPPGDLLLHAGDLSNTGSFAEIQAQLDWLNTQPHTHKVVVAGNHDRLLDTKYTADDLLNGEWDIPGRRREDLRWGGIRYLEDSSVSLDFHDGWRNLNIYGSPWTLHCGNFAFQYPSVRDRWRHSIPSSTDIVLTHGPPLGHLDSVRHRGAGALFEGTMHMGAGSLLRELWRVRPRLCVFGHIHEARGREVVLFDAARRAWEEVILLEGGLGALGRLVLEKVWGVLGVEREYRRTEIVNAALVPVVIVI